MIHKTPPAVSKAIRASAEGEDCALRSGVCDGDPATTVLAHLRIFGSAGVAQKPHDFHAVYSCASCHRALDAHTGIIDDTDILRALMETQRKLYQKGLLKVK